MTMERGKVKKKDKGKEAEKGKEDKEKRKDSEKEKTKDREKEKGKGKEERSRSKEEDKKKESESDKEKEQLKGKEDDRRGLGKPVLEPPVRDTPRPLSPRSRPERQLCYVPGPCPVGRELGLLRGLCARVKRPLPLPFAHPLPNPDLRLLRI